MARLRCRHAAVLPFAVALAFLLGQGRGRPSNAGWGGGGSTYRDYGRAPNPYGAPIPGYPPQRGDDLPQPFAPSAPGYGYDGAEDLDERGMGPAKGLPRRTGTRRTRGRAAARRRRPKGRYASGEEEDDEYLDQAEDLDPVDVYCQRLNGRLAVTVAAGVVGTLLGGAISSSTFHKPAPFALGGFVLGVFLSIFRNDFGDLFRALGLMLILLLERNRTAGSQYSAVKQIRPALRLSRRRPFPPTDNPWSYTPVTEDDVEFSMIRSLIAVGFVGCFLGWMLGHAINLFIVPPWLLALAIGGMAAYSSTVRDPRGDLVRCLGMKLVAFFSLLRALDDELMVLAKLGKVFNISYGTMARLDRRYKVREKVWALAGWLSARLTREALRVRTDMGSGNGGKRAFDDDEKDTRPSAPPSHYAPRVGDDVPPQRRRGSQGYDRPPPFNPDYGSYR